MSDLKVKLLGTKGTAIRLLAYGQIKSLAVKYPFFRTLLNDMDDNGMEEWDLHQVKEKVFNVAISYLLNNKSSTLTGLTGFEFMEFKELMGHFNIRLAINLPTSLPFNSITIPVQNYIKSNNNTLNQASADYMSDQMNDNIITAIPINYINGAQITNNSNDNTNIVRK